VDAYAFAAVGVIFVVAGFLTEQIGPALISMGLAFLAVAGGTAFLSRSSPSSHPSPVVTRWARGRAAVSGTSEPPCQQGEKWWSNFEGRRGQSLRPLGDTGRGATYRHLGIQARVLASPNRGSMHGSAPPSWRAARAPAA
jgi:hypothetical protein